MSYLDKKVVRTQIEEAIGSKGRLRIVGTLASSPMELFSRYALGRKTGIRHSYIKSDLEKLVRLGWVEELNSLTKKYRLNTKNPQVEHILEFLKKVDYI
jgi:DNA-binding IclR family transcriptional regulator